MLEIITISANKWNENCFILVDEKTQACLVIDPGYDDELILSRIEERKLRVETILATHAHNDHIASVAPLQAKFGESKFYLHPMDLKTMDKLDVFTMFLKTRRVQRPTGIVSLEEGQLIPFHGREIRVLHTPGHTPGGCMFLCEGRLFSGDLLLKSQKELQRLPGYDAELSQRSMHRIFDELSGTTEVFPGHGRQTTLAQLHTFLTEEKLLQPRSP